jgi:16S rRNA (guanine966-N2)-methyltransferase
MRVIAGEYRSRPLSAPRGIDTRPTSDRLRETLFNVLSPRIAGSVFADLYAGSGALGIEALSRGAREAIFVEKAEPALRAIRANLAALGIRGNYALEARSVSAALRRFAEAGRQLDIVTLDPPWVDAEAYTATLTILGAECATLLGEDAIVVAEHQKRHSLVETYGCLTRFRILNQGDAALSFYRRTEISRE